MKKILFMLLFVTIAFSQIDNSIAGWYNNNFYVSGGDVYSEGLIVADESSLGSESLNETGFATTVKWTEAGDFTENAGVAFDYAHSGGTGSLTQAQANLAVAGVDDVWYVFAYTISAETNFAGAMTITTGFASSAVSLNVIDGTHTVYFKSKSTPVDFVISVTSTAGSFTIDDVTLKEITGGDGYFAGDLDVAGNLDINSGVIFVDASDNYVGFGSNTTNTDNQIHIVMLGTKDILIDGSTDDRNISTGTMRFEQKPNPSQNNTRAVTINIDNNNAHDTHAHVINFSATGMAAGEFGSAYDVNLITNGATGGTFIGLEVSMSGTGTGIVAHAIHVDPEVIPIYQLSGTFGNLGIGYSYESTTFTNRTTEFNSTGTDVEIFAANGDLIYIGKTATFNKLSINLAIFATNPGIKPKFEFVDGAGTWSVFTPTDETQGFRQNGIISWVVSELSSWGQRTQLEVTGDAGETDYYWIRITRETSATITAPTEDILQVSSTTIYSWDEDGKLVVNNVAGTTYGSDASVSDAELLYINSLSGNAQTQLSAKLENVVEDVTPQLGADLDIQAFNITGTGYWQAGIVAFGKGGTGMSNWTQYLLPYAATTTSFGQIAIGASGEVLTSGGAGVAPSFQAAAGGGDFADGGEAGGAARTLGNTDGYNMGFLTNNIERAFFGATTGHFLPNGHYTYDLGATGAYWNNLYAGTAYLPTLYTDALTHISDADTKITFNFDEIVQMAGGIIFIKVTESTTNSISFGGLSDIDIYAAGFDYDYGNSEWKWKVGKHIYYDVNATEGHYKKVVTYNSGETELYLDRGNFQWLTFGAGNITTLDFNYGAWANVIKLTLIITQDGTGSRIITNWDANILWEGGTAPTLTTTGNSADILEFIWDGGTVIYGKLLSSDVR